MASALVVHDPQVPLHGHLRQVANPATPQSAGVVACQVRGLGHPFTGTFDRSQIPPHPKVPESLLAKCEVLDILGVRWLRAMGTTAQRVETVCKIMLAYNTVSTTLDSPEDLQGVFWMEGNKVPEELACLSYAASTEQDGKYLFNRVNGVNSWTYLDSPLGKLVAWFQERGPVKGMLVLSFKSRQAKDGMIRPCESFDYQDIHWGMLLGLGEFTVERLEGPGVDFKRGCYWLPSIFGRHADFGSYKLRKIMHTDGSPVQPAYGDFMKYMETKHKGVNMIMSTVPTAEVRVASPDAGAVPPEKPLLSEW
eukprot:CAMPEP_0198605818 /NCGR_PEP_ID=MMETSP1462-20131121/154583_1 /TAXON_ID=1333877 /ORGANISM="Brandtodinium nutriculum, Strain RCC3387" /LENGTH=307 /DNA_ID=CAMNT_0044337621 /DNA_START=213 /DNA_END=1136 /DNA_ORIENTATION=-